MDDAEFIRRMQERIEESTGIAVSLELDYEHKDEVEVFFTDAKPRVVMGADALDPRRPRPHVHPVRHPKHP